MLIHSAQAGARPESPTPQDNANEKPLTLHDCFESALVHNQDFQIQEEELRAAEGRYFRALSTVLPHLSVKGSEFIQDTSGTGATDGTLGSTFLRKSRPEVAINLSQPIFQGLREYSALTASSSDKERNRLRIERARELLFLEVTQLFLTVKELEADLEILTSQGNVLDKRIKDLRERVRLGRSRSSEILTTESQRALLEAEISKARGQLAIAREMLSFTTGIQPEKKLGDSEEVFPELLPLPNYLPSSSERADVLASDFDLKLSKANLLYERGGYLPELRLEGNYYPYRVGFQKEIDWDVLFTLNFPIFSGLETKGKTREAKAKLKQAEYSQEASHQKAELEIKEAYHELTASRESVQALDLAVKKAEENFKIHQREYNLGLVSNLELLQSLRDLQEVRREANRTRHQSTLNSHQLKIALGETVDSLALAKPEARFNRGEIPLSTPIPPHLKRPIDDDRGEQQ
ncbi:MAG: TolC family protein [Deltaproteobacteria bacterium]|nr:TolC family protein [Deltaproteobacteria bacterium]